MASPVLVPSSVAHGQTSIIVSRSSDVTAADACALPPRARRARTRSSGDTTSAQASVTRSFAAQARSTTVQHPALQPERRTSTRVLFPNVSFTEAQDGPSAHGSAHRGARQRLETYLGRLGVRLARVVLKRRAERRSHGDGEEGGEDGGEAELHLWCAGGAGGRIRCAGQLPFIVRRMSMGTGKLIQHVRDPKLQTSRTPSARFARFAYLLAHMQSGE